MDISELHEIIGRISLSYEQRIRGMEKQFYDTIDKLKALHEVTKEELVLLRTQTSKDESVVNVITDPVEG